MPMAMSGRSHMYKNAGRTQAFRLQMKCAERLREKRMAKFESFRQMETFVRDTVSDEMKGSVNGLDQNAVLELYESVCKALIQEQYDELLRLEDERLADDIESYLNPPAFCPACLRSPLVVTEKSAACQTCPFVHTFSNESMPPTQSELRRSLSDAFLKHETTECVAQPMGLHRYGKLRLHCRECGFETVVI